MTCNDKCIHFPVCEQKKYDFANIDECQYYEEERPHGEWIVRRNKQRAHIYSVCSKCNVPYLDTDFPNYCPNCGADMRKEGGEK